jgi:NAD(P)H dehydrogenase (quinone)
MADRIVLVVFYSRDGETERLAHAAAVGAVQARALIRLRRMADADPAAALARHPGSAETLRRMHREYIAPRDADVVAAGGLILASRGDVDAGAAEWRPFVEMLETLHADGRLAGKTAGVVAHGAASASLVALLTRFGFAMAPSGGDPVGLGRAVAEVHAR